ncbi:hypothetical protein Jolie2_53 [Mycobacterium phage Jolie2]|uniref:Uncharacterized protein n=1 Tax=Mycobacterium phage Jolie2 TaxID=1458831 RepID=W8EB33_9CAUD|nr:hypothetical protein Jolie2_53 [Mycobacterium phage Jolie2]AHJ86603.1 hypothetical protein Jolie2_53 [Mycobacterium phage Jolie2]
MTVLFDMEHRHDPAAGTYGDCWRACIATVTQTPIEHVPHFVGDHFDEDQAGAKLDPPAPARWLEATQEWLRGWYNCLVLYYDQPRAMRPEYRAEPSAFEWVIYSGPSPRGEWLHCVVGDQAGNVVHDPHPDRTGLAGELDGVFVIVRAEDWREPVPYDEAESVPSLEDGEKSRQ